jgi:hypothetical protein
MNNLFTHVCESVSGKKERKIERKNEKYVYEGKRIKLKFIL